jgi:hypothetical protein
MTPFLTVIARHQFLDAQRGVFESGRGRITVLPLVWPGESGSVEGLAEATREAMLACFRADS